ncbi:hypothetical protein J6590_000516 [Homalodisca vitripennis]|nr:hypothetical protein J6590_000516 [Homalodisca vitripennis]
MLVRYDGISRLSELPFGVPRNYTKSPRAWNCPTETINLNRGFLLNRVLQHVKRLAFSTIVSEIRRRPRSAADDAAARSAVCPQSADRRPDVRLPSRNDQLIGPQQGSICIASFPLIYKFSVRGCGLHGFT